ncbi:MAG: hypothetical protein IPF53_17760 [Blastocatellia bacterium]|nr:hypothetical protein [Blastocatellia bacterium]
MPGRTEPSATRAVTFVVAGAAIAMALSCGPSSPEHQRAESIVRSATSVETYRIHTPGMTNREFRKTDPNVTGKFVGEYPVDSRGLTMPVEFADRLEDFLLDSWAFWEPPLLGQKACVFDPGVVFRMRHGADYADVVICFDCDQLVVETTQGRLDLDGGDFDLGRGTLVKMAKEAFPDDDVIRALAAG